MGLLNTLQVCCHGALPLHPRVDRRDMRDRAAGQLSGARFTSHGRAEDRLFQSTFFGGRSRTGPCHRLSPRHIVRAFPAGLSYRYLKTNDSKN